MTFILDHLTAVLVGGTLLGALLFMQQRGQQAAIETNIRHRTETQTSSFLNTLTRDIENARTAGQITSGLGAWAPDAKGTWGTYSFGVYGTKTRTDWLQLVTLSSPESGSASSLQAVAYEAVELADSVEVGGVTYPLYRVDRHVYESGAGGWEHRGGSAPNLIRFSINATNLNGKPVYNWRMGELPSSVEVAVEAAEAGVGRKTGDLAATTRTNATSQALSVRIPNASSTTTATAPAPPGGTKPIPAVPGIGPYVPPVGPGPGSNPPGTKGPGSNTPGTPPGSDGPGAPGSAPPGTGGPGSDDPGDVPDIDA